MSDLPTRQSPDGVLSPALSTSVVHTGHSLDRFCRPGCITLIDYENAKTPLSFSRSYRAASSTSDFDTRQWRHRYEIKLTRAAEDRVVFDHHGRRHHFALKPDGSYGPIDGAEGVLQKHNAHYRWTDGHGIEHRFYGSFLTSLNFPDNQSLTLHYERDQLKFVTDDQGRKIEFFSDEGNGSSILLPDGRSVKLADDPCQRPSDEEPVDEEPLTEDPRDEEPLDEQPPDEDPLTEEPPEQCDTEQNPVPGFDTLESRPGVVTLDARPSSCQSYFVEFYGTVRGEEIEAGLEDHFPYAIMVPTYRSFPAIDFINGNELVVVRSRDLASPTYNDPDSPDALYQRLLRDGEQIQTRALDPLREEGFLAGSENGRTTLITYDEQQHVTLHLVIRQDMASPSHWRQIEDARIALAQNHGISLQVIIIP